MSIPHVSRRRGSRRIGRFLQDQKVKLLAVVGAREAPLFAEKSKSRAQGVFALVDFRQAMPAAVIITRMADIRPAINQRQQAAGFERAEDSREHRLMLSEFVVGVHHQHGIETGGWKLRIVGRAVNRLDLCETFLRGSAANGCEIVIIQILGVDFSLRTDAPGELETKVPTPTTDIGNDAAGTNTQRIHDAVGMLPRITFRAAVLPAEGDGRTGEDSQQRQNCDQKRAQHTGCERSHGPITLAIPIITHEG